MLTSSKERYLQPVLEDDPLLYEMDDGDNSDFSDDEEPQSTNIEEVFCKLDIAEKRFAFMNILFLCTYIHCCSKSSSSRVKSCTT